MHQIFIIPKRKQNWHELGIKCASNFFSHFGEYYEKLKFPIEKVELVSKLANENWNSRTIQNLFHYKVFDEFSLWDNFYYCSRILFKPIFRIIFKSKFIITYYCKCQMTFMLIIIMAISNCVINLDKSCLTKLF